MTTQPNSNPDKAEEIRIGITGAMLMMPKEPARRAEEIHRLHHLADEEAEAVAEAKEQVGLKDALKTAQKVYGISKTTLQILKLLDKVKAAGDRAAIITQVVVLSKDMGDLDKDLVTLAQEAEATAGQGSADQGSVFDSTTTGQRQGGTAAQPRTTEKMAATNGGPASTPGIPLDEALKAYEAANAAWGGKGRKPKAVTEAAKAVEAAEKAKLEAEAATAPAAPQKPADDFDNVQKADAPPPAPKGRAKAASVLDDDLPPPAPGKGAALAGASGNGSYTLN